jgi:PAS domain S-box-containing protein
MGQKHRAAETLKYSQTKEPRQEMRDNYRTLFEKCPAAVLTTSTYGKLLRVNERALELFGCSGENLVGKNIRELCLEPTHWDRIKKKIDRAGSVRDSLLRLRRESGEEVDCLLSAGVQSTSLGNSREYECVLWDMTEYNRMLETLRENEERYHRLVNSVSDGLWTSQWDQDMNVHITYLTDSIANIIGYDSSEVVPMALEQILTPSSVERGINAIREQLAVENKRGIDPNRSWTMEIEMYHKSGGTIWAEATTAFLRDKDGRPIGTFGVTRNITERKRYEAKLRSLSSRLVELQEAERRHIARELHDQIGQSLTGLRLLLEMIPDQPTQNVRASIDEAQGLINDLMNRVKDLSLELRPSMLDDLGLMPTLLRHFERYKAQTHVSVNFKQRGIERRFAPDLETAVFRIVQEGLTNVARHASVSTADVRIVVSRSKLKVQIEDRGSGFDAQILSARGAADGIAGMQERASLLGGRLAVNSIPGVGTQLMAEFPLRPHRTRKEG